MIDPGDVDERRADGDRDDYREYFFQCKRCGQAVDTRDLGQVMYHEMPNHDRLEEH